ncbi:tyrosine-type recombinase/integrase [Devosia sp. 1566]|uniref:tyrosine-type recombinase/integrase n=1 Tax=Devosia sp. 1566 TaxID=2499144 RepID=UPI0032B6FF2F
MSYAEVGEFMGKLAQNSGMGATALRFLTLTAGRTGEVMGAKWAEIDLARKVWTVPAERMKAGREHRVPLSGPALTILDGLQEVATGELMFPGAKPGRPISNRTMTAALEAAGGAHFTVHGMRSAFRDWVHEETAFAATWQRRRSPISVVMKPSGLIGAVTHLRSAASSWRPGRATAPPHRQTR